MRQPVIVNLGVGVDSVGMLVGLATHRDPELWPDLILFADTGAEKPETYRFLHDELDPWLVRQGFPQVTVVKYRPVRAAYDTLEGNCLANETLPSIAFRGGGPGSGGCSLKWKAEVMDAFIRGSKRSSSPWHGPGWEPFHAAKAACLRTLRLIGYDASPTDSKRRERADKRAGMERDAVLADVAAYEYRYPLQEWGWTRDRCIEEIARAGLPVPVKSACFFCPASKKHEIAALAAEHPDLFARAIEMEDRAAHGKHGLKETRGLGINFRWRAFAETEGFLVDDIVMPQVAAVAAECYRMAADGELVKIRKGGRTVFAPVAP